MTLDIFLQQTVLRRGSQCRLMVLTQGNGHIGDCVEGKTIRHGDVDGFVSLADMLCQELTDGGQTALNLRCGALHFTLTELHQQQVVAVDGSYANHIRHVLLQLFQHIVNGGKRQQFLLQRDHLPVVLLGGHLHLVGRYFQLQFAGLDADLCQPVAIDDLTTHEDRLYGRNGAVDTFLHQADVGGYQTLRNQTGKNVRKFDVIVYHGFVVLESKTHSRYLREKLRKRLALHLFRLLDGVAGRTEVVVILDGKLLQLVKGISGLCCCGDTATNTTDK